MNNSYRLFSYSWPTFLFFWRKCGGTYALHFSSALNCQSQTQTQEMLPPSRIRSLPRIQTETRSNRNRWQQTRCSMWLETTRERYRIEVLYWVSWLLQSFPQKFCWESNTSSPDNKKNFRFAWNPECSFAFEILKAALIDSSVLINLDYNSPFIVETDASDNSLGTVLSNIVDEGEYPVCFASRVWTPAECCYSTNKREALAVIQAMKWFKAYICGTQFALKTDHAWLQWLFR